MMDINVDLLQQSIDILIKRSQAEQLKMKIFLKIYYIAEELHKPII